MSDIQREQFRWAMSFRYLKRLHEAYSVWKQWVRGEKEDLVRASELDFTSQILEDLGKQEMALLLRTERDHLLQKVQSETGIRKRRPRRTLDEEKPFQPSVERGQGHWAAAS